MKKFLALILALTMVFALAACGTAPVETPDAGAPEADAPAGKLVMGTNAAFPPYEFKEGETIVGIDADIAAAIAAKLGMELEIKDMAFESLIPAVAGGSVDIVLAGMTVTDERKESVNFSESYATGIQSVIIAADSAIATIDDLTGKVIGVQTGTTGDIYCSGDYGEEAVKRYDNGALAVQALLNGQIDCVVIDNQPAQAFVAANEGLKILDTEYAVEDYAIAIAKEDTELLANVNAALAELKAEGKIDEIVSKYIKAE
ncbi:MAG: transporter substrate-binding domain-containing protein [Oscillospiraceae bacterium]|nr:transporter substrate-binding domain-containing protein [Oscillospiraceae bacterium]